MYKQSNKFLGTAYDSKKFPTDKTNQTQKTNQKDSNTALKLLMKRGKTRQPAISLKQTKKVGCRLYFIKIN
jgi:hypothetical protein